MQWNLHTHAHICTHTHSYSHTHKELIKSWNMLHAKQHCEPSADSIRRTRFCCETKKEKEGREMKRERQMLARETRWKNVNKRGALTVKWKIIIDQLAQRCKKDIWSCEWRQYANMQHSMPYPTIYTIYNTLLYLSSISGQFAACSDCVVKVFKCSWTSWDGFIWKSSSMQIH